MARCVSPPDRFITPYIFLDKNLVSMILRQEILLHRLRYKAFEYRDDAPDKGRVICGSGGD